MMFQRVSGAIKTLNLDGLSGVSGNLMVFSANSGDFREVLGISGTLQEVSEALLAALKVILEALQRVSGAFQKVPRAV